MGFKACTHFFRKSNKIFLTKEGIDKLSNTKLTGTKIAKFFNLKVCFPDEEDYVEESEESLISNTPYKIWTQIFNFPFVPKKDPKKSERYRSVEDLIKQYVSKQLGIDWTSYPLDKYDVFENSENLGGVPDAVERSEKGEIFSVLEIKTITDIKDSKTEDRFSKVPINYQLQLALYLYLNGLQEGYIAICYLFPDNWDNIDLISLKSNLSLYSSDWPIVERELESWIPEIGVCKYSYQILEAYCNNDDLDNELIVFKIKVDMEEYENLIFKIEDWFKKHKNVSPEMSERELKNFLSENKLN